VSTGPGVKGRGFGSHPRFYTCKILCLVVFSPDLTTLDGHLTKERQRKRTADTTTAKYQDLKTAFGGDPGRALELKGESTAVAQSTLDHHCRFYTCKM
jgi:hypothetical protein